VDQGCSQSTCTGMVPLISYGSAWLMARKSNWPAYSPAESLLRWPCAHAVQAQPAVCCGDLLARAWRCRACFELRGEEARATYGFSKCMLPCCHMCCLHRCWLLDCCSTFCWASPVGLLPIIVPACSPCPLAARPFPTNRAVMEPQLDTVGPLATGGGRSNQRTSGGTPAQARLVLISLQITAEMHLTCPHAAGMPSVLETGLTT
jgi:hypothetical protein